jgi:hypothetical protein
MKLKKLSKTSAAICGLILSTSLGFSQGTAFTYQGQLESGGNPVTGLYDFTNALYNASSGPAQVGPTVTHLAVPVTNGLFTVLLDFGAVFNGTSYWLQIGVRSNGVGSYVPLSPRQELTPAPYAITAQNLTGLLPSGGLSGTYPDPVNLNNPGNSFTGNGAGLTGLNASQVTTGTLPDAVLPADVALLHANQTFTRTNRFEGPGESFIVDTGPISTSFFTGLGLQYYTGTGEGAIMSSYNNGYGFLSFYTKQGPGYPLVQQMQIDKYGGVAIDQQDYNNGVLNDGTSNGVALTFGIGSGEGIASKRTPGGNQNGLDFYTGFNDRMSILNNGYVGIGTASAGTPLDLAGQNIWNVAASEGDFRIGNPLYRLKIGVATGGGGAGDSRVYAAGGTSRLILGGETNDVLTVNGHTTQVGVGTLTPNANSTVDIEGSPNYEDGLYVFSPFAGANAIEASANNGANAYAVFAHTTGGYGVYATSDTGTATYAYSGSGSALTIGGGAIHVSGATTNSGTSLTTTAAFIHVAAAANISANYTRINNSLCNGDPNAILSVTPNLSPAGTLALYNNHPIGVWYDGSQWTIFQQDNAAMPAGASFNVLVIKN